MWIDVDGYMTNMAQCENVYVHDVGEEDYRIELVGVKVGRLMKSYLKFDKEEDRDAKFKELKQWLMT